MSDPLAGKRCSPEEAASRLRARDSLALPLGPGQPAAFLHALSKRDDFEDLRVFTGLLVDLFPLFARPGVHLLSGFFGPVERALRQAGHDVRFVPGDFRRFSRIGHRLRPRVLATVAAPPDAEGRMSLSLHAGATAGVLRRAGRDPDCLLVVEVNPRLPRTRGVPPYDHWLHVDEADLVLESDLPVFTLPETEPTEVERRIADHAVELVPEGATLQTGIGGIPSRIVSRLAESGGGDYGIHTEMFTTGLMRLVESGKVTNRKGVLDGLSIATFAAGSEDLYRWLDGRQDVAFLPVEQSNAPELISRNRSMVSINGALSIDLWGQVAADALEGRQYSGIGGHEDFVSATGYVEDGRALVCLPSTAEVGGRRVSRIVPRLAPDTLVTTPRHQIDVVVTEWGTAELFGLPVEERGLALVRIAHPDYRDELLEACQSRWGAGGEPAPRGSESKEGIR